MPSQSTHTSDDVVEVDEEDVVEAEEYDVGVEVLDVDKLDVELAQPGSKQRDGGLFR